MPKYAYLDATQSAPQPVIGWLDTDVVEYPNLPAASDLLQLSEAQWAERMSGQWAVQGGSLIVSTPQVSAPSLAQQASAMLAIGMEIVSASTPALNGTYAVDANTRADALAEMVAILDMGTFTNGAGTLSWPDTAGNFHTFTVPQFKTLAQTMGGWVGALKLIGSTNSGTLPSAAMTIP